ncbi:GNAT family N-acetyltransferase [Nocardioides sp.]|uniref:GNAT family N-acetyltransferase n=1 Tax=Nocardioides sp. TaxID=35761 RepID=UPI0035190E0A
MSLQVRPAVVFEDIATLLGPRQPTSSNCFCLSHRIPSALNRSLRGQARSDKVEELLRSGPLGVIAYDDEVPVGWAAVAPRSETGFARSRTIPRVDDLDVWSVWCLRVRPGHRGRGLTHRLIAGAVGFARERGAPALEAYPLDNAGRRIEQTMAYVGTRAAFEAAGFRWVAPTGSVLSSHPRVLMRHDLATRAPGEAQRGADH